MDDRRTVTRDPNLLKAGRKTSVRFNKARTLVAEFGTGLPVIEFVDCEPMPDDAVRAVANSWVRLRRLAASRGVGLDRGDGRTPNYKFAVALTEEGYALRLSAMTPFGRRLVPPSSSPALEIDVEDWGRCKAVADALIWASVQSFGSDAGVEPDASTVDGFVREQLVRAGLADS